MTDPSQGAPGQETTTASAGSQEAAEQATTTVPAASARETPAASPETSGGEQDDAKQLARRIKIGTQRPGVVAPKAKPLPLPAAAQRPKPRPEETSGQRPATAEPGDEHRRARSGANEPGDEGTSFQARAADFAEQGTATGEAPAAPMPRVAVPSREKVEMPNLRQLSPELEKELADALGDMSLEEIVKGEAAAAAGKPLEVSGQVRGRIVSIHNDDVFVDLGQRNQGVLSLRQFPEGATPVVGGELEVVVGSLNAEDGLYQCSLPGGPVVVEDWSQLAEGAIVEVTITGHNKGGLECQVHSIRGFIPAGQISLYRVEDFSQFVGQKFTCVVNEANPRRKNLILSRRAVLEREKAEAKEKLMASLAPGQVYEGVVRKVMDFGAFVDLGGVDGLVHVSRMSWQRVRDPRDLLKEGEHVRVQVEKIDPETHKISLSMREFTPNPWADVERKYPTKTVVHGPVTKIMDFGAFVELEPGVEGLVHISELAHHRVFRVVDVVKEGEEIDAEVLSVDRDNKRISLSIKALLAKAPPAAKEEEPAEEEATAPPPEKPKQKLKLKGGLGRSTGTRFGLKW
jgi:small subunit ribosomal protein S1